jgi:putative colanic acid biosynthesis UDP-glucose lipid carrier transferase
MKEALDDKEVEQIELLFPYPTESESFSPMHLHIITQITFDDIVVKERKIKGHVFKRAIDISISLIAVIFILPLMFVLIGILIMLESKGPILFKQLRSGAHDKLFWCYKFRTMFLNDESDLLQATKGDKRVTKIGRFLRRSSIDEFPQFINILKGDMSLVGPRPHMPKLDEIYSPRIGKYSKRLAVKQGLTGWAQVNGFRGETNDLIFMEKRIEHDIWYIENWSLWLDIKIIFRTFFLIFREDQCAY